MKKAVIIFLCVIFTLQLSACKSRSEDETAKASETVQKTTEAEVNAKSEVDGSLYICVVTPYNEEAEYIEIQNADADKFNKLIEFYEKNCYEPDSDKSVKTRAVDASLKNETRYSFLIMSSENPDCSAAEPFFVLNGKLVMGYFSDMFTQKMFVVDVPDEISDYFVSKINKLS